jgi:hypothetical protein
MDGRVMRLIWGWPGPKAIRGRGSALVESIVSAETAAFRRMRNNQAPQVVELLQTGPYEQSQYISTGLHMGFQTPYIIFTDSTKAT